MIRACRYRAQPRHCAAISNACFLAVVYLLVNLAVDLAYAWLDPRIRYHA